MDAATRSVLSELEKKILMNRRANPNPKNGTEGFLLSLNGF